MKNSGISRPTTTPEAATAVSDRERPRREILRTAFAVTLAVALIATGAIALPSLAPEPGAEFPAVTVAPLEPTILADIEGEDKKVIFKRIHQGDGDDSGGSKKKELAAPKK